MPLAVVGTDTEVGKTVVSAIVLNRYGSLYRLAYWKPVASGACDGRDVETVRRLVPAEIEVLDELYLLDEPLSPHLAARLEGIAIDPASLQGTWRRHVREHPELDFIVEGIGGLLVPLNDEGDLLVDLLGEMSLPCLLVARSTLGTINHTLLSLEALRAREIEIAGVVLDGPHNPENRWAIEVFGGVDVVGEIEPLDPLDVEAIEWAAQSFDSEGVLERFLSPRARRELGL